MDIGPVTFIEWPSCKLLNKLKSSENVGCPPACLTKMFEFACDVHAVFFFKFMSGVFHSKMLLVFSCDINNEHLTSVGYVRAVLKLLLKTCQLDSLMADWQRIRFTEFIERHSFQDTKKLWFITVLDSRIILSFSSITNECS